MIVLVGLRVGRNFSAVNAFPSLLSGGGLRGGGLRALRSLLSRAVCWRVRPVCPFQLNSCERRFGEGVQRIFALPLRIMASKPPPPPWYEEFFIAGSAAVGSICFTKCVCPVPVCEARALSPPFAKFWMR